ncbi:HAMP domain-containing protein [Cohnella sp. CFH 77786]|uniref:sensor histidine kinase n=1 Tax=Cohnella sp. CFH 77786 TaxID=2662265 RepID=UPI001C60B5F7|nr:HAMP domain-containing sensor histidine kinase [Cohnella sp. CFH 77786]MBW5448006.1 HAMP domain-containing protein [Cohnella sp. CFH 77786]
MSIKTRLLLSYIAMTVIPVVLFALIAFSMVLLFLGDLHIGRQGPPSVFESMNEREELFAGIKFMAQTEPDRFADPRFLASTDKRLNGLEAGLVVVRKEDLLYSSPFVEIDGTDLYRRLSQLTDKRNDRDWGPMLDDRYMITRYDFTFGDRSSGTVYMLTDSGQWIDRLKTFFPILVLSLLAVIALTNGVLTWLVSRSIIRPLNALKQAAERIKDGDLNQEIRVKRKDEIGKLGAAFEEMRVRLRDSIRLQLQYEENRKELVSNISHDLKTPITGIKACLEGIRDGIADSGPKRDKYMDMIERKTEDMDRLIDELFLFSKLDLNRLPFQLEPTNLTAYMRDCVDELRLDPRMAGIRIGFDGAVQAPVDVLADREKLRRVIMNIVDNSLKYMDKPQKEIRVELIDGQEEALVRIGDNGSGIDEAALPHIFDRFYRAEPSRNTATGGSGLGLAIVKQMVEGQGGRVWAESRPGEGTVISFTLPKTAESGEKA